MFHFKFNFVNFYSFWDPCEGLNSKTDGNFEFSNLENIVYCDQIWKESPFDLCPRSIAIGPTVRQYFKTLAVNWKRNHRHVYFLLRTESWNSFHTAIWKTLWSVWTIQSWMVDVYIWSRISAVDDLILLVRVLGRVPVREIVPSLGKIIWRTRAA